MSDHAFAFDGKDCPLCVSVSKRDRLECHSVDLVYRGGVRQRIGYSACFWRAFIIAKEWAFSHNSLIAVHGEPVSGSFPTKQEGGYDF